jgi:hypothetical protein
LIGERNPAARDRREPSGFALALEGEPTATQLVGKVERRHSTGVESATEELSADRRVGVTQAGRLESSRVHIPDFPRASVFVSKLSM